MRAPDGIGAWDKLKAIVARLGADADDVLITSFKGGKSKLRIELESIGVWVDVLHRNKNPTARQIAGKLKQALDAIDKACGTIKDVKKAHWPRRRLYEDAESRLNIAISALTEAAAVLRPEHDVLDAAPAASKSNAASVETLFRCHALRIWRELGGDRLDRADAIDFLVACENLVLGKPNRETVQKWLARNWPQADTSS